MMNTKIDPYATKTHRRINALLFVLTVAIIALFLSTSARGSTLLGSALTTVRPLWSTIAFLTVQANDQATTVPYRSGHSPADQALALAVLFDAPATKFSPVMLVHVRNPLAPVAASAGNTAELAPSSRGSDFSVRPTNLSVGSTGSALPSSLSGVSTSARPAAAQESGSSSVSAALNAASTDNRIVTGALSSPGIWVGSAVNNTSSQPTTSSVANRAGQESVAVAGLSTPSSAQTAATAAKEATTTSSRSLAAPGNRGQAPDGIATAIASFTSAALGAGNATLGTTVSATTLDAGLASAVVARGSGVGLGTGTARYNSNAFNVASEALAISGNRFFNLTISPAANYSYSLTSLGMTIGSSGTGPNAWSVYAGAPGFSATTQLASGTWTAGGNSAITPSMGGGFTGLTTSTEIRMYAWGASGAGGTFGPGNGAPLDVNGTTTLRSAGTLIWDGGQGTNWNAYSASAADQSSWNSNNTPTTALVDSLQFAGSTETTTNNNIVGLVVDSIAFNSGASAFTINGNALTVNSGVTNNSSNLQTINLALTMGGAQTFDAASGNLTFTGGITNGGFLATFDGANNTTVSTGAITGGGGLTKIGAGTLTLTAANSYTGGTTVDAGTLLVNGNQSSATGAISVNNTGTTLGGVGTAGGAVTVNGGANITGGTNGGVGAFSMTSLDVVGTGSMSNEMATFIVDLAGATADYLNISGALILNNFSQILFQGLTDGTSSYLLATFGSISNTFGTITNLPMGYSLVYGANSLTLSPLTPVPEPSTWAAGLLTLLALGWTQRRRFAGKRAAVRG